MYRGPFPRLALCISAVLMAGCTSESTTGPRIVSVSAVSGLGQSGLVGAVLTSPLVVRAEDQNGSPVEGALISWTVLTGGGTIAPSQSVTGADGQASATLRLGSTVGQQTAQATLQGAQPVTFTATATSAPASQLASVSGDNQTATVKTGLPAKLVVKASDAFGNAKAGVLVVFQVVSGGGTLSASSASTGSDGLASVDWTLGSVAGTQRVSATTTGVAPVNFSANALAAAPANLQIVSGSGQSAAPGARLQDSLVVRVTDAFDNPVKDAPVTWAAIGDAGRVSPTSIKTDGLGRAAASWTLGATGGPKQVSASVSGLTPVEFQAAGTIIFAFINAGGRHSCALDVGGVAYCWGFNGDGQLGIGQAAAGSGPVFAVPAPIAVSGNITFGSLSAGGFHTCAATLSANPYCWGKNVDGRLGDGKNEQSDVPDPLSGTNIFIAMSAGASHSCALTPGGRIFCWGSNAEGQVGVTGSLPVPVDSASFNKPQAVLPAVSFRSVAAGGLHSCAVTSTGAVWCWGNNASGQLGNGTTTSSPMPVLAASMDAIAVTAGTGHSCALKSDGTAWCWGDNSDGQLGTGNTTSSSSPVAVSGGLTFVSLSAGSSHTCGLTRAGIAYCWGRNSSGQLGDGTTVGRTAPVAVGGGLSFGILSAGALSSCGVTVGNVAYCWGDNQFGQLGDNTQVSRSLPGKVAFQP